MDAIDVFDGAYRAKANLNNIERKGVIVKLTADGGAGMIRYEVSVIFFPYRDPEDFGITYDAVLTKEIYNGKGRRSKKREEEMVAAIRETAEELILDQDAEIYWDQEIRPVRRG
jgi:hypothetical protein